MTKDLKQKGRLVTRETILLPVKTEETLDLVDSDGYTISPRRAKAIILVQEPPMIVHFTTKRYSLQSNESIINIVEPMLKEAFGPHKIEYRKDGPAKSYMDYIITSTTVDIGKGDKVHPRIRIQNSYDGSLKFGFTAGAWRMICKNGMTVGNISAKLKFMHTASLDERVMNDVVQAITLFTDNFGKVEKLYKEMAKAKVKDVQARVDFILEETKFPKKKAEEVVSRAILESKELGVPMSDWIVFNAFNYQLNHDESMKMAEHKKQKLDNEILTLLSNNPL